MNNYVLIAGVHKAGTTSLFTHLSRHPEINFSKVKETHYFSSHLKLPNNYYDSRASYNNYMDFFKIKSNSNNIFLEASPEYMYAGKETIYKIKKELGNQVKLIFILRNPIEQIFSQFSHKKTALKLDPSVSFDEYIRNKSLEDQKYYKHLKKWYLNFDEKNIKIIFFDNLKSDPENVFIDICKYLNIDTKEIKEMNLSIENKTEDFKNRTFHKIALFFNRYFEFFLRRNFIIKKFLRNIYRKVNIKKKDERIDLSIFRDLNIELDSFNSELKKLLQSKGYSNFPEWMG